MATVTIDTDSAPGSYRAALNPEGPRCAACGQGTCTHSDLVFHGVVPPVELSDAHFRTAVGRLHHRSGDTRA